MISPVRHARLILAMADSHVQCNRLITELYSGCTLHGQSWTQFGGRRHEPVLDSAGDPGVHIMYRDEDDLSKAHRSCA